MKKPEDLRSARWFAPDDLRSFGHRSRAMQMGYAAEDWDGRPLIGIINTWSDINPCHLHLRERAEDVKRGVLQAGGFPIELPALSLSEQYVKPTTMLYRNMLAMETEELLRSHPIDGAVLMGGCDKTTPALVMGAVSAGVPCVFIPAGPMLRGNWKGKVLGSGSDAWKYWDDRRAGNISAKDWQDIEGGIARSHGTCMTMGTASTMTAIVEAIGLTLPGASSIPAPDANHLRMSAASGRRIVEMVWEDLVPAKIMTRDDVRECHHGGDGDGLLDQRHHPPDRHGAAWRAWISRSTISTALSRTVPVIANIRPSGENYLMEDFFYAGGLRALMKQLARHLHLDAITVTGKTLGENIADAEVYNDDVIRPLDNPIYTKARWPC